MSHAPPLLVVHAALGCAALKPLAALPCPYRELNPAPICCRKARLAALTAAGVPSGPINDLAEVFEEPQVWNPVLYSRSKLEYRDPPPLLGQHTTEVLTEVLGLEAGELQALRAASVIT